MTLKDFMAPGETIRFSSSTPVNYQGQQYNFYITNRRLIWHKLKGMVFKKDNFICEAIENVTNIEYKEMGLLTKKGVIKIAIGNRKLEFNGSVPTIRAIYGEAQSLILSPEEARQNKELVIKHELKHVIEEKKAEKKPEVKRKSSKVQRCSKCDSKVSKNAVFCPSCGKALREKK